MHARRYFFVVMTGEYRTISINVKRQPTERRFLFPLLWTGINKSPHFLTVTDSRPLERHFFPTYMNDRTRISPPEYIVAGPFLVRAHLFELFYILRFFIINISRDQTAASTCTENRIVRDYRRYRVLFVAKKFFVHYFTAKSVCQRVKNNNKIWLLHGIVL